MKILGIILLAFLTWVLWLVVSQYLFCARFQFDDPVPFEGLSIFNPYDSVDAAQWVKCNFHAHSRAWEGFTNGHGSAEDIHEAYKALNYGVHCVSNYHYIDTTHSSDPGYIPAYEHGYNITKTHQLVLGSDKVLWLDYLFPQSVHNKQHVLKHLSESAELVILNHPALKNAYTKEDLSQLNGYDCMEVLSPSVVSIEQWDAALSAGKKVFIVGNDDTHNVLTKNRLGRMCTFINVAANSSKEVLTALKTGRSYGVVIGAGQLVDSLPFLKSVKVMGDTVFIKMSNAANHVTLTGQNGKVLASLDHTDQISYRLSPSDHYSRATFEYENGTKVYLNPVFYIPKTGYRTPVSFENVGETIFFRAVGVGVLSLWVLLLLSQFPGIRRQRFGRKRLSLR
ncbi:hypothetical protein MUK70_10535 [Dyadobacter chenwenxiniae]|uniref:Uncharacterized protein n=1 Tax=Dyadobacter chenwenxiniae TaxID=2906456 RepID=A0A9X1PPA5_9BACT|nr:hypothetical protein [Dyadobacter chenwenxiniae]MCF0063198.1 hypothetical protein [Dyadobacter chenwenxiniae]UON85422.1 hypothetical protein MUK70_10535 [Dyadobacter chenwenxiniae]